MGAPTMRVVFEPVGPGQSESLLALARSFHAEDGRMLGRAGEAAIQRVAEGDDFARAWLLMADDRPAGYVVLTLGFSIEYGGRDGFLDDFYVVPAHRGRGLGRQMLAFALHEAERLGIQMLHLEVEPGSEAASRLYRSAGFAETGRRLMRVRLAPDDPEIPER